MLCAALLYGAAGCASGMQNDRAQFSAPACAGRARDFDFWLGDGASNSKFAPPTADG
jgi:hypothetical protein